MNAKQAARASKIGEAAQRRRAAAEAKAAAAKERELDAWELKHRLPVFMKEIRAQIAASTAAGERSTAWHYQHHLRGPSMGRIRELLTKDGYQVEFDYRQGEANMGDFNAPYNVTWRSTDVRISWLNAKNRAQKERQTP